jgi:DNA-binding beta-propeller fold protein YncE
VLRGTARGQALEPSAVAVDAFSHLLVADAGLHRVQWLDAHGRWLSEAGALGSGPGELRAPVGLAPLGSAGWALLDRENHRVTAYDLFGRLTGVLVDLDDDALTERLGRVDPVALATDRGGALYVADADRDRLLVFDFSGAFVRVLGGFGNGPGSFRGLAGVGVTPRGELVTAERVGARVQRLDSGGQPRASWRIAAVPTAGLLPVAVDDSGRVAVGDERGGRVWVFEADGRLRASLAGLRGPRGLTFAPDGTLLVAEAAAGTVTRYRMAPAAEGAAPARK